MVKWGVVGRSILPIVLACALPVGAVCRVARAGLPVDTMCTQNALIVSNARRWPLVIDPQAQANKWIRKLEEHSGLVVVTPTDADIMRKIEVAVEHGRPVLMESVGDVLDSYLDPVLLRQVFVDRR